MASSNGRTPSGRTLRMVVVLAAVVGAAAVAGCEDPALKFNRTGMEAYRQGNYTQARAAFEEAIETNPDVGTYYFNRGMCEQALGNYTEAIFNYQMATKLDAGIVAAYKNAADCYLQLGKPDEAREMLEQGTRSNPYQGRGRRPRKRPRPPRVRRPAPPPRRTRKGHRTPPQEHGTSADSARRLGPTIGTGPRRKRTAAA